MEIQGTVISYSAATKITKQGGGTYDAWELVYRTPENEVKQLAKPIQGLKFNTELRNGLASLAPNDEFTVVLEKSDKGFWEVLGVSKGGSDAQPVASPVVASSSDGKASATPRAVNRVTGSTYETPEERAKKQVIIVAQSCLAQAVSYAKDRPDATLDNILDVAEEFEKFVNRALKAKAKKYLDITLKDNTDAG